MRPSRLWDYELHALLCLGKIVQQRLQRRVHIMSFRLKKLYCQVFWLERTPFLDVT
jgi:hypothetical protein